MTNAAAGGSWLLALFVAGAGIASARSSLRDRLPAFEPPSTDVQLKSHHKAHLTEPRDSAWLSAPFRVSRTPPTEAYTPERATALDEAALSAAAAEAAAIAAAEEAARRETERPPWTLKGMLLGNAPVAIFEGPNGPDGSIRLIAVGEIVDGFTVSEVHADRVVVTRGDLAWTFALVSPWS